MKKMIETTGKTETTQPTMLEQVWGYNELSKYGTVDEEKYQEEIQDMHRADLETHARKVGVIITENTNRLREKLLTEFRSYVALLHKPSEEPKKNISAKQQSIALKILSEGK